MEAGALVWVEAREGDDAWILSEVKSRSETELNLFQVSEPSNTFSRPRVHDDTEDEPEAKELKYEGVELANTPLSDQEKEEGKDNDMITLPHLHEPAILHAIGGRFDEGKIYTWTGPVLIAVNPFERLDLYTDKILGTYRQEGLLRSQGMNPSGSGKLGPHIYAIADLSYRQMMAPGRKSQAILISGESGAGKTESTKIVMRYLTTLGSANMDKDDDQELSVMDRVLQSNPILEAFGNAKTLRNDNSSRFGKFIELGFNRGGQLLGAKIQTYLLEKVRLGSHASGERNYHIFYQLLRGASDEQKKKYGFHDGDTHGLELARHYNLTGQGGAPNLREFTDEAGLKYTMKAMKKLGWDDSKTNKVLSLVAGLLHLGQIEFDGVEIDGEEKAQVVNEPVLNFAAELLGVDEDKLTTALLQRILVVRKSETKIRLSPDKAADSRDALAKTIYGALFLWIVSEVNNSVIWKDDSQVTSSVGVLDIFGFECFPTNSFEQLCINYTNESLQQQFNKFIFKMEQIEYEKEEISWDFISFPDNQDCLDLIQKRPAGVLTMLDDECKLGTRGSDKNWADRLYKQHIPDKGQTVSENQRFEATPIMKSRSKFIIRHFAGPVEYSGTTGFLEKNKDEIPVTAQNLFESADSWLIKAIYDAQKAESNESASSTKGGQPAKQKTVSQQFKEQLSTLMEKIGSTQPHYIRCLKPNDAAKPKLLTRKRLTEQLRYGGVLEAVRVARMGFPVRLNHTNFFQQYRMLLPTIPDEKLPWQLDENAAHKLCVRLVEILLEEGKKDYDAGIKSPHEEGINRAEKIRRMQKIQPIPMIFPKTDVQLGSSKVFMRKPAHDALEAHRIYHQTASATILQAWMRGAIKRRKHLMFCDAVETLQRFSRGCIGRERWWNIREDIAAHLLTNVVRMHIVERKFFRAKKGTIGLQCVYRGHAERRVLASIKIQTQVRMRKDRVVFCNLKSATTSLQCQYRCGVAKKILTGLKGEQKDIGKLKENNEKLKLEMASLKAMLSAQGSQNESEKELNRKKEEIEHLEKRIATLEAELEKEKEMVKKLETEMESQRNNANKYKEEAESLRQEKKNPNLTPISSQRRRPGSIRSSGSTDIPIEAPSPPLSSRSQSERVISHQPTSSKEVDPVALAEHTARVKELESELNNEREARRSADAEVEKLRAKMNGHPKNGSVQSLAIDGDMSIATNDYKSTNDYPSLQTIGSDLSICDTTITKQVLIPSVPNIDEDSSVDDDTHASSIPIIEDVNSAPTTDAVVMKSPLPLSMNKEEILERVTKTVPPVMKKKPITDDGFEQIDKTVENIVKVITSPRDFLPVIKRGLTVSSKSDADVVDMGWKVVPNSRKEREESLRDEVQRFELKMKNLYSTLENGGEVTMWQLNLGSEYNGQAQDEFTLKNSPVQVKLQQKGGFLVQAVITFTLKGNFFANRLNKRRLSQKNVLDPLSLNEILEVKAGCMGYEASELPITGRAKKVDSKQSSYFLTMKAAPTPVSPKRLYFLKFKSTSARNDLLMGLRGLLADLQIKEGVHISSIGKRNAPDSSTLDGKEVPSSRDQDIMIPLSEVHKAIDIERAAYDRLLLLMLQGASDLRDREKELMTLRGKMDDVINESKEKDKVQANDSKLIMQLSKKLETLLMDNEDLREQLDNMNNHLVAMQSEKLNYSF